MSPQRTLLRFMRLPGVKNNSKFKPELMLSNPLGFPNWMAIIYSGFATLKVSFVSVGLIFLLIISIALAVDKIKKHIRI